MIKAGIIGLGKMGISHAAIVGAHPAVDLVGVCDTSSFVLGAFNKFTKVKTYTSYEEFITEQKPDAIFVSTPTKSHYQIVKYAVDRNINVFCEKPFCLNLSEGKELVELVEKKKLVNQVGYHNHFIGTFIELKRLLRANVLGELVHFQGEAYGPVVTKEKVSTWRSKREEGGGCLYDYASHVINLLQETIGAPIAVRGTDLKSIYSVGIEDAVYSNLELKSGLTGTLSVNWSDETYRKMSTSITIQGKNGKIICDATELKIFLKKPVKSENLSDGWTIKYITEFAIPVDFYLRGEEYSAQIDHFVMNVDGKKASTINTFAQAFMTDSIINMLLKDNKK